MRAVPGPTLGENEAQGENVADVGPTILDALRAFERHGFTEQFMPSAAGIKCLTCGDTFPAARVPMRGAHRVEGVSDPDDMVAIAALSCPGCGVGGTLVLKYGPMAPAKEQSVLHELRDERTEHPIPNGRSTML